MAIHGYFISDDSDNYKEGQVYVEKISFYQDLKDGLGYKNEQFFFGIVYEVLVLNDSSFDPAKRQNYTDKFKVIHKLSMNEMLALVNNGSWNTGFLNDGDYNSGNHNQGDYNSGNHNSGDCNTGDNNTGSYNTGDYNGGNFNVGSHNSGHYNSGSFNAGNKSYGIFNTEENPKITMFDKPSNWTMGDWENSKARQVLIGMPEQEARQSWWDNLPKEHRKEIMKLPNFNAKKFLQCTGITV